MNAKTKLSRKTVNAIGITQGVSHIVWTTQNGRTFVEENQYFAKLLDSRGTFEDLLLALHQAGYVEGMAAKTAQIKKVLEIQ